MSFLISIPTWRWFDIGFNVTVLVALGGETEIILRWVFPDKAGYLLPPETKRKELKKFCEWLLIFGIAGEISCLPFSLYGTSCAEKDAAEARLETKRLEAQIAETSANVANLEPRRLSQSKQFELATLLRIKEHAQGVNTKILYPEGNFEAQRFANDIAEAFKQGGMNVSGPSPIRLSVMIEGLHIRVKLSSNDLIFFSPLDEKVVRSFLAVGLSKPEAWGSSDNPGSTNEVELTVGAQSNSLSTARLYDLEFDLNGKITDWGNGAAKFIKNDGIHISSNGEKTHLQIDFNRSLAAPPLLTHRGVEALGEAGNDFFLGF